MGKSKMEFLKINLNRWRITCFDYLTEYEERKSPLTSHLLNINGSGG